MLKHLLAIVALGVLCGAWFAVQRWVKKHDPEQPGVEGQTHCGGHGQCRCQKEHH
ncbi:MAG: hypothetical protein AB1486_09460 [Planctomycetota bacterium]